MRVDDAQAGSEEFEAHGHAALVAGLDAEALRAEPRLDNLRAHPAYMLGEAWAHVHEQQDAEHLLDADLDVALAVRLLQRTRDARRALLAPSGVITEEVLGVEVDKLLEANNHSAGGLFSRTLVIACACLQPREQILCRADLAVDVPRAHEHLDGLHNLGARTPLPHRTTTTTATAEQAVDGCLLRILQELLVHVAVDSPDALPMGNGRIKQE